MVLSYLSLASRFAQASITASILRGLLGISQEKPIVLAEVLGEGPARLVLLRDEEAKILHPLIAEEILKQCLSTDSNTNLWREKLVETSCLFIDEVVDSAGSSSLTIQKLFMPMFVSREPWQERAMTSRQPDRRPHFSELILAIPNEAGQHRVLLKLKDRCPDEANFWNHLGRHHIYAMRSKYTEAEQCLKKAVQLDSNNDIHHHALGMVYRFEISNRFNSFARRKSDRGNAPENTAFLDIQDLYVMAEDCFSQARDLDAETEYGYITNIQLILEIIEGLYRLSGKQHYADFLSGDGVASEWCREKLPLAEELLRKVKLLKTQDDPSRRTVECQGRISNIYGDFDSMINSLQNLLNRGAVDSAPIRRTIADAYLAKTRYDWTTLKTKHLQRIYGSVNFSV